MDLFRVRLNCVDHYQATPLAFDPQLPYNARRSQQKIRPKVPVIRIFGATETGQKVCAHVHGAFPYLYIKHNGSLIPDDGESELLRIIEVLLTDVVDAYIHQLHLSIDHALAVSYRRNAYDGKTAFVAHISLVKGVPFYGYHVGYEPFLKIYMLNPLHMTRLADILRQGTVMNKVFQPYESHMQYILQWMCDYNLYGCAFIDCKEVRFRSPVPDYMEMNSTTHQWHNRTIPSSLISDGDSVPRQSHCSIEVDICVQHILNRLDIKSRPVHRDFLERETPITSEERLVPSMAGLWRDETKRRKARMGETDPGSSPFSPEDLVSVSADSRNTQPGGWVHEEEYREKIAVITEDEKDGSDGKNIGFENLVTEMPFGRQVKTSLESVEDFYPESLASMATSQHASQMVVNGPNGFEDNYEVPDVDEERLLSLQEDDFPYESDEELARELEMPQDRKGDRVDDQIELLATDGAHETLYDNKDRLANSEPIKDPADSNETTHVTCGEGPTSSTELKNLGIRDTGDYDNIENDAFEIPDRVASDISADLTRISTTKSGHHRKRRKLELDGSAPRTYESEGSLRTRNTNYHSLPHQSQREPVSVNVPGECLSSESPRPRSFEQERARMQKNDGVLSSFQDGVNGLGGNRKLSFPIVKDPQDPNTILKLSQKSSSPLRYSQSNAKSASFAKPSEHSSRSYSHPERAILESPDHSFSQTSRCCSQLHDSFQIERRRPIFCFAHGPPSKADLLLELRNDDIPSAIYEDAHYSDEKDVPERAREYAGKEFKLESGTVPYLPNFDPTGTSLASIGKKPGTVIGKVAEDRAYQRRRRACGLSTWEFEKVPPTRSEVQNWLHTEGDTIQDPDQHVGPVDVAPSAKAELSQIDGATQNNHFGFKYSQRQTATSVKHETQYMSIMSLEIHVNTRNNLVPNPEHDEVCCLFWCFQSDDEDLEVNGINEGTHVGILALSEGRYLAQKISQQTDVEVEEEDSELDLINRMVDIVRNYDPDILTGYEVHGGSWGYIIERARCRYDYNLCDEFSRMKAQSHGRFGKEDDRWGFNHTSTIRVTGRHMINIWRAMRGELNLLQYTMENVVFQLCHRRIPHYSFQDLTHWYSNSKPKDLAKVLEYYVSRVQLDLEILEQNELISRTSEQARILGVDFFSVFSRGSQFKVESLMFRIAKPEDFLLPSPSRKQVGQQNALECLPLVMEPQSAFYNSPLLVLDFQSLYPSVMIAYNYCYSTFVGRVINWRGQNKMGFSDYQRKPGLLELLEDQINIAPNGIMYAKPDVRKSLLAKMLGEILETRVMVKSGMKVDKDDKKLQRLLNNRQLALKLIANVTYGYTSASFSGRMPCSEIADSIVQTGRETLEKAIALIHSVERWRAEVVYGDTDSIFVYLKGRTKEEAFDIGQEISKKITDMNPRPIKLKFEKVYFPCVLLAKKRYVGFKYESKDQKVPDFDAKGIETVRRDGTPAEQKIEERALKILFRTADLSQVKIYFQRQCSKIMQGKISIQDFCFAKEVKLGTYSDRGLPPPGALISTRKMLEDPRAEPQYGERVPYVVITGAPGARLIDRCVAPDVLLRNDSNELDAEYYISKNLIPPLERIFNLVGANVRQWYDEMPKIQRIRRIQAGSLTGSSKIPKKTIESYMKSSACLVCREKLKGEPAVCGRCQQHADTSVLALRSKLNRAEKKAVNLERVCRSCAGLAWSEDVKCDSKDCPVFYTRTRHMTGLRNMRMVMGPAMEVLQELEAGGLDW